MSRDTGRPSQETMDKGLGAWAYKDRFKEEPKITEQKVTITDLLEQYTLFTRGVAVYPKDDERVTISYVALGLNDEAGEVAGKVKKYLRGDKQLQQQKDAIQKELGDVFWYWIRMHDELGLDPLDTIIGNMNKLSDRKGRGVLRGDGDER